MKPHLGPEVAQSNRQIRKMLRLAKISRNDVFYDLGCGRAQPCIIAVTEFGLRRAVGIDSHKGRASKAGQHVKRMRLSDRIEIRNENFYDSDLTEATVVYNGLIEDWGDLQFYDANLGKGCRLVTLSLPLVGVLPTAEDYPFYLMKSPFKKTKSLANWTSAALSRRTNFKDFSAEIRNDPDYRTDFRLLESLMRKRLGLRRTAD